MIFILSSKRFIHFSNFQVKLQTDRSFSNSFTQNQIFQTSLKTTLQCLLSNISRKNKKILHFNFSSNAFKQKNGKPTFIPSATHHKNVDKIQKYFIMFLIRQFIKIYLSSYKSFEFTYQNIYFSKYFHSFYIFLTFSLNQFYNFFQI